MARTASGPGKFAWRLQAAKSKARSKHGGSLGVYRWYESDLTTKAGSIVRMPYNLY